MYIHILYLNLRVSKCIPIPNIYLKLRFCKKNERTYFSVINKKIFILTTEKDRVTSLKKYSYWTLNNFVSNTNNTVVN